MARRASTSKVRRSTNARPRRKAARDLERTYSRSQFIAKLRRFADALESRKPFTIQIAGERLHIPAKALFNIEHERAGGQDELEFQLRWETPRVK
ncbi:MAG: amphi-Trp domain-containing protein [Gemmatimonadales bacterium]|nr:amphi-Trp domain-containing protein [Gemmatimonadales bacterium]